MKQIYVSGKGNMRILGISYSFLLVFLLGFNSQSVAGFNEPQEIKEAALRYEMIAAQSGKMSESAQELRSEIIDAYFDARNFPPALPYLRDSWAWVEREGIRGKEKGRLRARLGAALRVAGYFEEALPIVKKSCEKTTEIKGEQSRVAVIRCIQYGIVLSQLGRYEEAITLLERMAEYSENLFGDSHGKTAWANMQLGGAYQRAARLGEAHKYLRKAFEIFESDKGSAAKQTNIARFKLAKVYRARGNYTKAEQILRKGYIDFASKKINQDSQLSFHLMDYLGRVFMEQGRYVEAEQLLKKSIEGKKEVLGVTSDKTIQAMLTLAEVYLDQKKSEQAETYMLEIIRVSKNISDDTHFGVRRNIFFAQTLLQSGRLDEAEIAYEKVKTSLSSSSDISGRMLAYHLGMGRIFFRKGEFKKAERFFLDAVEAAEQVYGKDNPKISNAKSYSAENYAKLKQFDKAVTLYREVMESNAGFLAARKTFSKSGRAQQQAAAQRYLSSYMRLMVKTHLNGLKPGVEPVSESFIIAEASRSKILQTAMLGQTARAAARNDYLSELVRREQDIRVQLGDIEDQQIDFFQTAARDGSKQGKQLEERRNELNNELHEMGEELGEQYPEYNRLINPKATQLSEVQKLLVPGELLLSYFVQKDRTLIWAVDKENANLHVSRLTEKDIYARVQRVRTGLDLPITTLDDIPVYDMNLAHELYKELVAPVGKQLEGVKNLIIVPHKALLSMPFGTMITAKTEEKQKQGRSLFSEYKTAAWLANKYAISIMPSATALVTMRAYAKKESAEEPFIGFGDPVFSDDDGVIDVVQTRGVRVIQRAAINTRSMSDLPNLPETREELQKIARALGATEDNIYLGNKATEQNVKNAELNNYRVVAFATHGLVAGDLDGLEQPALALTPPEQVDEENDGLLQMGEVLGLDLNAGWVILSACNTASGDKSLANEGLTGLTQAFFYAGSRALLVSLWPVESTSTQLLTTTMFSAAVKDNKLGRSASLQVARKRLIDGPGYMQNGKELFSYAHPIFWSAFIAVGEGGVN